MKDIRPALRSVLLADLTVSSLVGGSRIFPSRMPQGQVDPSVVYNRIAEAADYHMAGRSGLLSTRMQVDAWANRADVAEQLAGAVYDRLSGFSGVEGDVTIQAVFMVAGRDDFDPAANLYRTSRDYEIWYV